MSDPKPTLPPFVPQTPGYVRVFKSRAHTMGYVFETGTNVHFINHIYLTKNSAEIAELERECSAGHPNFYIDPEQLEMDPVQLDPMEALRSKIREEERIKLLLKLDTDMGTTTFSGRLEGIANSSSIRLGTAESGSVVAGSIKVAAIPASGATATKQ